MVGLIAGLATFSCVISEEIAGGDPFQLSDAYLHSLIWDKMIPTVKNLYDYSFDAIKWSAIIYGFPGCYQGVCFSPHAGCSTVSYNIDMMAGVIVPLTASLLFQSLTLSFIRDIAFTVILPIGFILKVFPFTRESGAFLMAAALGFYIVFPLMFVFNSVVMNAVLADSTMELKPTGGTPIYAGLFLGCYDAKEKSKAAFHTVGAILPQAVFLPAFNMIVTITFIRTASKLFAKDYILE